MTFKNYLSYAGVASLLSLFMACNTGTKTPKNESLATVYAGEDGKKFLHVPDAEVLSASWPTNNTLVVHIIGEPDQMHPSNSTHEVRSLIQLYTQKYLMCRGVEQCKPAPDLATDYPVISADHLRYSYTLRKEAKWDDGTPITVEDVLFSYKAYKCQLVNNPHAKPYLKNILNIEKDATNPATLTMIMQREYVQNVELTVDFPILQTSFFDPKGVLKNYTFAQLDAKDFNGNAHTDLKAWAEEFNSAKYGHDPKYIVGAGPYQFTSWEVGQQITITKKPNYWATGSTRINDAALPERIIFKLNKDQNSTMLELKSQVLDASNFLSMKTLLTLQEDSAFNANYNSCFVGNYNFSYLALNMKPDGIKHQPFLVDKNVRRAFALLTPCDDIISVVYKNKTKRITSMVSAMKPEYNSDLALLSYDVQQAKKLLDDAGWKDSNNDGIRDRLINGKKVEMKLDLNIMNSVVDWKDIANLIAESYLKAGIQVNIVLMDPAAFIDKNKHHDFDMILGSWGGVSGSDDFSQIWGSENWANGGSNYVGFGNAAIDALIDSCNFTIDPAKRIPLVRKFQKVVYDEQPYIFLNSSTRRIAIHKRWGNVNFYIERPGFALNNFKQLNAAKQ